MDRVLRNSKKSNILVCVNTHESVSMKALSEFDNLFSLTSYFTTEEICKEFLAQQRWGDDVVCPICGKHHCKQRFDGRYRCDRCKHNFSVISGTIFENTKVSLRKWSIAMYLLDDILQFRLIKSYCIFLSHIQFEISLLINTWRLEKNVYLWKISIYSI